MVAAVMHNKVKKKSISDVVQVTPYPPEAFEFVREGLALTVRRVHRDAENLSEGQRHVTGQELARALRDLAITNYGVLASVVLAHWNIHTTMDFGKIVFAMVENGMMHKTPEDNVEDFRDVYDFVEAFTAPQRPLVTGTPVFDLRPR
ncbi:MAG: Minf_1886 family protein [Phycisphaerae bacterium]